VVGTTRYCPKHSLSSSTSIGGTKKVSLKKIIDLKPDIIIANIEENDKEDVEELMETFPVFVTYPKNYNDSIEMLKKFQILFGLSEKINITNIISEGMKYITASKIKSVTYQPRVFYPIWKNPWMSINNDTFIDSMISLAGGQNIFRDSKDRYPTIDIDTIDNLNPDIILLPDEPYKFTVQDKLELMKNMDKNKIYLIDGSWASWYGVRSITGIVQLQQILIDDST